MTSNNLIYLAQTLLNFTNNLANNSNSCAKLIEEIILEKPNRMENEPMKIENSPTVLE